MVAFICIMYILLAIFKSKLNNEHKVVDIETDTADDSDSLDVVVEEILDFLLCGSLRQVCDHDAEVGSCVSLDVDHFVLIVELALENCQ